MKNDCDGGTRSERAKKAARNDGCAWLFVKVGLAQKVKVNIKRNAVAEPVANKKQLCCDAIFGGFLSSNYRQAKVVKIGRKQTKPTRSCPRNWVAF